MFEESGHISISFFCYNV